MPCCKAEKYGWCKDLPVADYKDEEGNEYCVFHAPVGKKGISAKEFNELIFERINLAKETNQSCNLSGTIFEWDMNVNQFDKNNPLPRIYFSEAQFIGEVDFLGSTFSDDALFADTVFSEEANFSSVTFNGFAYFYKAAFESIARFGNVTFSGQAVFTAASFSRNVYFSENRFKGWTTFYGTVFKEEVYFFMNDFDSSIQFTKTLFLGNSNFILPKVRENTIIFENVNMNKIFFLYTKLQVIDFINCIWPKRFGRNVLYDEIRLFGDERQPNPRFKGKFSQILRQEWDGFKKDIAPEKEMIKKVEILYRMLKQKYKEEHNEYEVSKWHYGEKEMFRKGSYFRRFFPLSLSNLYWLSSGYGERPVRAGIVLTSLIFILSILTALSGFKPPEGGFAAIILNTLQYATLQKATLFEPVSLTGAYLKLLTQILIPLQTALFALAIKNRFKR